jgi:hypothetical protein
VTAVRIRSVEAKYRLPPSALGLRQRLDDALRLMLDDVLEGELARLGLPADGVLCVAAIHVPVRLSPGGPLLSVAEAWARAFAAALVDAVRGHSAGVVWYPSRRHALLDFAAGVASGKLAREWAWRQAVEYRGDPLTVPQAARLWCDARAADPPSVVPVLAALAEAGVLERWLPRVRSEQWAALAAVAAGWGGGRAIARADEPIIVDAAPGEWVAGEELIESPRAREREAVATMTARVAARSAILRAYLRAGVRSREREPAACVLAVLEVEPALRSAGEAFLQRVAEEVRARLPVPAAQERSARRGDVAARPRDIAPADVRRPEEPEPIADPRRRAWTEFGGLLFLVGLAGDVGVPARLLVRARESGRSVRWLLHRLAMRLVPADAADPAALAFAGLRPDVVPPSAETDQATPEEDDFLGGLAGEVAVALGERLGAVPEATGDLIGFVCRRPAEVVADPGWFEVRFPLDRVSTEIRRAGLDLDPGYVPWLGVVLKFVYG